MLDCLLIADDLTGACDAAVHFAARGRGTTVVIECLPAGRTAGVLAMSTETRASSPLEVTATTADLIRRLPVKDALLYFKKIDSTLRGNPGLEIAAVADALACDAAIITPAFPAMRRVVRRAHLHVTDDDCFQPVHVAQYLESAGLKACRHVECPAIAEAIESGARFITVDAGCDTDLDRLVANVEALRVDRRILWAGSGGLAAAIARTLPVYEPAQAPVFRKGPVLFCIGSEQRPTMTQQDHLITGRGAILQHALSTNAKAVAGALRDGRHVVLRVPRGEIQPEQLRRCLLDAAPAAIAVSGGDTASLVCRALEIGHIELFEEIVTGIPVGLLHGGPFNGTPVATKAGGFGAADALIQVTDYFACQTH